MRPMTMRAAASGGNLPPLLHRIGEHIEEPGRDMEGGRLELWVRRDLRMLFKAVPWNGFEELGVKAPLAARSVLNYGVDLPVGRADDWMGLKRSLERAVRGAVEAFEPRFVVESLSITITASGSSSGAVECSIRGRVRAVPVPRDVEYRAVAVQENGMYRLIELGASGYDAIGRPSGSPSS